MPTLKSYETQVCALVVIPTQHATANDFGAEAGARLQQGASHIGAALADVQQRQEVSDVHSQLAAKRAQWTVELANRAASAEPGDMTFASKFQDDFSASMVNGGDKYVTRAGRQAFQAGSAELAAHFVASSGLYQADFAGKKAVVDYQSLFQNSRAALLADYTQFDSVLASANAALTDPDGLYAKMPADKRYALGLATQQEMAKSAVEGLIRLDPEGGAAALKNGKWDKYLKGDDKFTLERQADRAIRAQEVDTLRLQAAKDRAERKAQEATNDSFIRKYVDDPLSVSATDVANSNMTDVHKLQWVGPGGIIERATKDKAMTTDPQVFNDLFRRVHLPDGDPNKISDPDYLDQFVGSGGLNMTSLRDLRAEVAGKRTPDGEIESQLKKGLTDAVRSSLTKSNSLTGVRDPKGDENMLRFMAYFLPEYQRQRQAGKTPTELLDPDSKDYLGKQADRYKRPFDQIITDLMGANPDNPSISGAERPAATKPAPLRAVKDLQWSPTRQQYRDPATGAIYDKSGKEVK